jgi:predicted transcriptional regulator
MADPDVKALLSNLANRGGVIQAIDNGTYSSAEIANIVGKSRSSIDRDLRILKEARYINEAPDGYSVTTFGRFAIKVYESAVDLERIRSLSEEFPPDLPFAVIESVSIREAGGANPWEPIDHMERVIDDADVVKGATPAIFPFINDTLIERIIHENMEVEAVIMEDALKQILAQHPEVGKSGIGRPNCTIYKAGEDIQHGVIITDEKKMILAIFDASIRLLATLTSSSEESVRWAFDYYEALRESGEEVFFRSSALSTNSRRASRHLA